MDSFVAVVPKKLVWIQHGYIHTLSPIKRSKRDHEYFVFGLQVSPTKIRHVVGFDTSSHSKLQKLEASKSPVVLKGLLPAENKEDFILNQCSSVDEALPFDVELSFADNKEHVSNDLQPKAVTITLSEIETIKVLQKVNVTAPLTMGSLPAKLVATRTKDKKIGVKEDCVLEDEIGKSVFHVWGDPIDQLEDGHTYLFENLVVRQFQSATFLSTIYDTKFAETEQQIDNVTGPSWLESPITDVVAKAFKFLHNLSVFYPCQACNRKMTEITGVSSTIKCSICGVSQKLSDCNKEACASLSFLVNQITNWKVIHIRFVEAGIEKIGHRSSSSRNKDSGITGTTSLIDVSIIRPPRTKNGEIPSSSVITRTVPAASEVVPKSVPLSEMIKLGRLVTPKREHDMVTMALETFDAENGCWADPIEVKIQLDKNKFSSGGIRDAYRCAGKSGLYGSLVLKRYRPERINDLQQICISSFRAFNQVHILDVLLT
eukprot:gene2414-2783_t